MSRYTGLLCESCKKPFTDNDDIVVCPDCGAPQHRSCYETQGHCVLRDQHSDKFVWQAQKPDTDSETRHAHPAICPNCNAANPPHGRYCQMCGSALENAGSAQNASGAYGQYNHNTQNYGGQSDSGFNYGGNDVFEHWDIDNVSSRELSAYTGSSSYYFLRQFKLILSTKYNVSWNWGALFFSFFYFFYRKMYKVGLALLGFYIVSSIPVLLPYFGPTDATFEMMGVVFSYNTRMAAQTAPFVMILNTMSFFVRIWCTIFANKLYLQSALKDIKRCREVFDAPEGSPEYYNGLYHQGRPNRLIVVLIGLGFFAAYSALTHVLHITPPV